MKINKNVITADTTLVQLTPKAGAHLFTLIIGSAALMIKSDINIQIIIYTIKKIKTK